MRPKFGFFKLQNQNSMLTNLTYCISNLHDEIRVVLILVVQLHVYGPRDYYVMITQRNKSGQKMQSRAPSQFMS